MLFLSLASSFAYRNVEASLIAPFEYVTFLSALYGDLDLGDYPSSTAWIGMSLIISSGIYVIYRKLIRLRQPQRVYVPGSAGMIQNKKMIKIFIIFPLNNDYRIFCTGSKMPE